MKIIEYNESNEFLFKIMREYSDGDIQVICPKCKEEMLVVLTPEDIHKHQKSYGMYCINGHIQDVLNIK